jgi:pyruvate kinase
MVTLSPSMPHFARFAQENRLSGIRVNSAMITADEMEGELQAAAALAKTSVPFWFDLKGRQLRIRKVVPVLECEPAERHVELELNHRIAVNCPTPVLFKAGEDGAELIEVRDQGKGEPQRLIFAPGYPRSNLKEGESLCIRDQSFRVLDNFFPDYEIERIQKVATYGWTRYVLSYVESQRDIDEFRQYVGPDVEVVAKIESRKGLDWVANGYRRQRNLRLLAARGDLYVEVPRPHQMLAAQELIIEKDPDAIVGSRILLSLCRTDPPESADFSELAWLYSIGYRTMMLCDDLCLHEKLLGTALNVFEEFREDYANRRHNLVASAATKSERKKSAPYVPPVPLVVPPVAAAPKPSPAPPVAKPKAVAPTPTPSVPVPQPKLSQPTFWGDTLRKITGR